MLLRRVLAVGGCVCLAVLFVSTVYPRLASAQGIGPVRTDALVLVNSTSAGYPDFAHFVQPYLDNFGVPYTVRRRRDDAGARRTSATTAC